MLSIGEKIYYTKDNNFCEGARSHSKESCTQECPIGYHILGKYDKECTPCQSNWYSTKKDLFQCELCPYDSFAFNILKANIFDEKNTVLHFDANECFDLGNQRNCHLVNGWKFRKNYIINGNFLPSHILLVLSKYIQFLVQ